MASPPVKKTSWLREKLSKKSSLGSTGHTAVNDLQPYDLTAATRHVKAQRPSPDLKDPFENGEDEEWAVLTIEKKKGPSSSSDRSAMDLNHTDGMFLQGANKNRKSSGGLRMSSPVMGRRSAGGTPGAGGAIKSALKPDKKDAAPDRSPSAGSGGGGGSGVTVVRRHSGRRKLLAVDQGDQRNGSRSVSPNTSERSSGSRRKNKAVSPGPSSSPMDESPSAGGYQESAFAKVRDTLRIQKAKKKKKKPSTKQVMQYSVPDFTPSSKYQDPFEAQPNFTENGEEPDATGHEFTYVNIPHNHPEYCDHCGQNAWGHHQVLKCTKCEFTCHKKCEPRVFMRCSTKVEAEGILHQDRTNESLEETIEIPDNRDFTGPQVVAGPVVIPPPVHPPSTNSSVSTIPSTSSFSASHSSHLSSEKAILARKIRDYNRKTTPVHHMHIKPRDCNIDYVGFVRVHMCIQRPIHVSTGVTRTSWYRLMRPVKERSIDSGIDAGLETAFYLPTDTNRLVHITNVATTKELIVTLLKKFCITDNHRKFSLYEEYGGDCRRLFDEDHPLEVVLEASVAGRNSKLVLRDNLHSTIQWDAFTMPELSNFIAILQREEEIYASKLRDSFMSIKKMITHVANEKEGKSDSPTLESQSGHPLAVTHVASS